MLKYRQKHAVCHTHQTSRLPSVSILQTPSFHTFKIFTASYFVQSCPQFFPFNSFLLIVNCIGEYFNNIPFTTSIFFLKILVSVFNSTKFVITPRVHMHSKG